MLLPRVIPCLDFRDGRVVKGVRFQGLRDAGDPVALADAYARGGADELVMLDVSATPEGRGNAIETVRAVRRVLSIPLTVGGGVRSVLDAERLLDAGADRVSVNSAAVDRPELVRELAERFGTQCIVVAVDAMRTPGSLPGRWEVTTHGGRERTGIDVVAWSRQVAVLGAGEILLTSWDQDGTREGYDLELLQAVTNGLPIPVIASGGAQCAEHLKDALFSGANAVLAASILHDGETTVKQLKTELAASGLEVRL